MEPKVYITLHYIMISVATHSIFSLTSKVQVRHLHVKILLLSTCFISIQHTIVAKEVKMLQNLTFIESRFLLFQKQEISLKN